MVVLGYVTVAHNKVGLVFNLVKILTGAADKKVVGVDDVVFF